MAIAKKAAASRRPSGYDRQARITLRDVMDHMNNRFNTIDSTFITLETKLIRRMDAMEVSILERIDAEANAADDTALTVAYHEDRLKKIEKHVSFRRHL